MLPPMLYRLVSTDLAGTENEGAYLLMCKAVLPSGMLGLMLGGMIFATASSVNTTLNLVAAVFTNDVYRPLRPVVSEKTLMAVARTSTVVFGIITIVVALLVPYVGGIVEVVLTIGAVTGCSIYGPPIWALFSKHHNGKSIWMCTVISLVVNLFCKFMLPPIAGISLTRSNEMLLGALFPFRLLVLYEVWARTRFAAHPDYINYQEQIKVAEDSLALEHATTDNAGNRYGIRVLATTLIITSMMIIILGVISEKATVIVTSIGAIILLTGTIMFKRNATKIREQPVELNHIESNKVS
jgi:Na+/proline symporter